LSIRDSASNLQRHLRSKSKHSFWEEWKLIGSKVFERRRKNEDTLILEESFHARASAGGKMGICPPGNRSKNLKCLENLMSAVYFRLIDLIIAMTVYLLV